MSVTFELVGYRQRNGQVLGTVRVLEDGHVVFTDGVNLSTARSRNQFYEGLTQHLNGSCPDQRTVDVQLLALLDQADAAGQDPASAAEKDSVDDAECTGPYRETPSGLVWLKPTQNGLVPTPLCTFSARIVGDVREDDGSGEPRRLFTMVALLGGRQQRFDVLAERFQAMTWVPEQLGPTAIIYPGPMLREHARTAIQLLSGAVPERRVLAHTGWAQVDGTWVYLHAGGAIGPVGPVGPVAAIDVHLSTPLDRFMLPAPPSGRALAAAVRASLRVLGVAPLRLTAALQGAVYRAVLGTADFAVHLSGPTGEGKTELAALIQQHAGAGLDSRHLPGSWSSTDNALEATAFLAKDTLFVVDDFAPTGTQTDTAQLQRKADRLFRAQGNGSGRQRMRADTSLRAPRYPRGVILSTGEDIPRGQSLRGRLVVLELGPGDVRWDRLSVCQADAATGRYAEAMAGFIAWLAPQYATIRTQLPVWEREQRERALASGAHRRTPDNIARLAAGWTLFLRFAVDAGALTTRAADALYEQVWQALGETAAAQRQYQQAGEPVSRFFDLLRGAVAGGLAHVAAPDGSHNLDPRWRPETWGWEFRTSGETGYYVAHGHCIGWLEGEDLYMEPEMSLQVAQGLGRDQGDGLSVGGKTLHRRLAERGVLLSSDLARGRLTVRKTLGEVRRVVLHVAAETLLSGGTAQSAQSAHGTRSGAPNGAGTPELNDPVAALWREDGPEAVASGPIGPIGPIPSAREAAADSCCAHCGLPDCGGHGHAGAPTPAPDGPIGPFPAAENVDGDADRGCVTEDAPSCGQHDAAEATHAGPNGPIGPVAGTGEPDTAVHTIGETAGRAPVPGPGFLLCDTDKTKYAEPAGDGGSCMTLPLDEGHGAYPAHTPDADVRLIRVPAELDAALPELLAAPLIGLDTETTGLNPHQDRLRLVQLATADRVYVVDCFALDAKLLAPLLEQGRRFAGHNLGFDLRFLLANGLPIPSGDRLFDTMIASQLLHSGLPEPRGTHSLAGVAERLLGLPVDKTEQRSNWAGALSESQLAYAAKDAAILLPLVDRLETLLAEADLQQAAALEVRALPAIAWLEHVGAPLDQDCWLALSDGAVAEQLRLEAELTALSGTANLFGESSVKWTSPDQVLRLLRQRGHPLDRTDEYVLQGLAGSEPLAPLLLQHREASRKASSYGIEFLRHVQARTGRIHADFVQIGASSGRMACGSPNLQNIPRESAYRACFRPAPGRALVKADYSQIELRIVAQVTREPVLLQAYREGADVHLRTAAAVMGVAEEQVTKDQRQLAKALNFGLLYGMGAPRLKAYAAGTYGVTLTDQQAETFRDRWFQTYPGLRRWHRSQPNRAIETRTLTGRRRLAVERFVDKLNLPIQGAGADILKLALARLWEDRAAHPTAAPVLCVHDEIVVECDAGEADAVAAWLSQHMEAAGAELLPDVPVVAEVTIAADWSGTPLPTEEGASA